MSCAVSILPTRRHLPSAASRSTKDNTTAIASITLGASIIEKHFTLDNNGGGPDDSFSLEPAEFSALCHGARTAWEALGEVDYNRKASERGSLLHRRSLYFVKDMRAGEVITADAVRSIRPGFGLPPKFLEQCLGTCVNQAVSRGTAVKWDLISAPND